MERRRELEEHGALLLKFGVAPIRLDIEVKPPFRVDWELRSMKFTDEGKVVHPGNFTLQSWLLELDEGCELRIKFPRSVEIIKSDGPFYTFKVGGRDGKRIKFAITEVRDFKSVVGEEGGRDVRHGSCHWHE